MVFNDIFGVKKLVLDFLFQNCFNFKLNFCLIILVLNPFFPFFPGMEMLLNAPNSNGEDLTTLEAEISELQRENARVETQMLRLKSDISAMESHLNHGERVRL